MATEVKKVVVTGATGYVASHVVRQLLLDGYNVRGTVRSLKNEEKMAVLKGLPSFDKLELVEADLLNEESIDKAIAGCTHVQHVASVFPAPTTKSEDEVLKPAIEGTRAVLKACLKHKVKRLVLTSSVVAITDLSEVDTKKKYTENDWGNDEDPDVYSRSKVLAEKSAWKFLEELEEKDRFELAVINPAFVQGPTMGKGDATSFIFVKQLLERQMPLVPNMMFAYCDVRDVAKSHVAAMILPEAVGKRHIISTGSYWLREVATILQQEFGSMGYNVPTRTLPTFLLRIFSFFDAMAARILPMVDKTIGYENTRMTNVLKIEPTPIEKTIVDMAHSMIEHGVVKKTPQYQTKEYL